MEKGGGLQLHDFFNQDEFDCNCVSRACKVTIIHVLLIKCLAELRSLCNNTPLVLTNSFRCMLKNNSVDGAALLSRHMTGEAVDILCPEGIPLKEFVQLAREAGFTYVKSYTSPERIHADIR